MMQCLVYGICCLLFSIPCTLSCDTYTFRAGIFHPTGDRLQECFGSSIPSLGVVMHRQIQYPFDAWMQLDGIDQRMRAFCCQSHLQIVRFGCGVRQTFPVTHATYFYMGVGSNLSFVKLTHRTCCGHDASLELSPGVMCKTGLTYSFTKDWFIDFYADWTYQKVLLKTTVDLSSLTYGMGLGTHF